MTLKICSLVTFCKWLIQTLLGPLTPPPPPQFIPERPSSDHCSPTPIVHQKKPIAKKSVFCWEVGGRVGPLDPPPEHKSNIFETAIIPQPSLRRLFCCTSHGSLRTWIFTDNRDLWQSIQRLIGAENVQASFSLDASCVASLYQPLGVVHARTQRPLTCAETLRVTHPA